jgi:hypothetical protein
LFLYVYLDVGEKYTYKYIEFKGESMGKYRIEIIGAGGKTAVNIEGCKSIEKYTSEKITVLLTDISLTVFGKGLSMPVMVDNNLRIIGYVKGIELVPKGDKDERLL